MKNENSLKSFEQPPQKNQKISIFIRRQKNVFEEHTCSCRNNNFAYKGITGVNENSEHVLTCQKCKSFTSDKPRQTKIPFFTNTIFFWEPIIQN